MKTATALVMGKKTHIEKKFKWKGLALEVSVLSYFKDAENIYSR